MIIEMTGVREHGEGLPVDLVEVDGRLVVEADNNGTENCTRVDLVDLIAWVKKNRSDLLAEQESPKPKGPPMVHWQVVIRHEIVKSRQLGLAVREALTRAGGELSDELIRLAKNDDPELEATLKYIRENAGTSGVKATIFLSVGDE